MTLRRLSIFLLGTAGLAAGCGDNKTGSVPEDDQPGSEAKYPTRDCSDFSGTCVQFAAGSDTALQDEVNSLDDNTTLVLSAGKFAMTKQLTIRNKGIKLVGQGLDGDAATTLDFGKADAQGNGVDVAQGDGFLIADLVVLDSPKDGIRVENTDGVTFHHIRATWTTPSRKENGAYGIYPVHSKNVLVEDSEAHNASDAGLYVGQCQHVIVRNNTVSGNVAGLEIENVEYADVYGNTATNNTGGIVVFDLPGNPIIGHDIRLRDNMIHDNNHINFASGGTVADIPVGTGTFAMASRRVEITNNTYANNDTGDIAVISGLTLDSDPAHWVLAKADLVGTYDGLVLDPVDADHLMNFRSTEIVIAGNHHSGSGKHPDIDNQLKIGLLLSVVYATYFGAADVDSVLYDTVGEGKFQSVDAAGTVNTNDNHICVAGNTEGTFASLDVAENQAGPPFLAFYRPAAPFKPFNCTTLTNGAVAEVTLPATQPALP